MRDDVGGPERDLGPFATERAVAERLGAGEARGSLLAVPGDDGTSLYPLFQFHDRDGGWVIVPGLAEVMTALSEAGADPLTVAVWLTAETEGLGARTAIDHLRAGGDVSQILVLVAADRARWESR